MNPRATFDGTVLLVTRDGLGSAEPDRLRVGTACGMPDILNAQLEATKVITL